MIFVLLLHPSRTAAAALPILVFSVFRPLSANIRKEPRGPRLARLYFTTSLALSRNFLKFLFYFRPTRVNLSTASSTAFPDQVEGAALPLGRLPPPFSFFGVSFSTGQSRSFRSASSTACAKKKSAPTQPRMDRPKFGLSIVSVCVLL